MTAFTLTLLAAVPFWLTDLLPMMARRAARVARVPDRPVPGPEHGMNFTQYVGGENPMPGLGPSWLRQPELTRFDYVLLRSPSPALLVHERIELVARDGQWALFTVRR
ncbi:hypothetical protein BE17_38140 [Sorangium cellulosum]|uniref:Uncharacterized protein n=1 Tax=Sorangium cellulosum TaxID=56 RepID=A0A150RIB4_SORCE|nr:hypothetical protein BE17_38140 [Sorangium cellulosum]